MAIRIGARYLAHVRDGAGFRPARAAVLAVLPPDRPPPTAAAQFLHDYALRIASWSRPEWQQDLAVPAPLVLALVSDDDLQSVPMLVHPAELVGVRDGPGGGALQRIDTCDRHGLYVGAACPDCTAVAAMQAQHAQMQAQHEQMLAELQRRMESALARWREVIGGGL